MAMLEKGAKGPPFSLKGTDGGFYTLSDALLRGPVLAVFFKTNCGACDLAFPYLNQLMEAYKSGDWQLWAISQDPLEKTDAYAKRLQLKFPILLDTGFPASKAYDPPATPTLYLINNDGSILFATYAFSKEDINELSIILGERLGLPSRSIAEKDDGCPDFRPG